MSGTVSQLTTRPTHRLKVSMTMMVRDIQGGMSSGRPEVTSGAPSRDHLVGEIGDDFSHGYGFSSSGRRRPDGGRVRPEARHAVTPGRLLRRERRPRAGTSRPPAAMR